MAQKLVSDPERLVASIEAAFPPAGRMDQFFGFDTQLFQIAVPDRLGLDMLALGDQEQLVQARQRAAQEAGLKIRSDVQTFVADCVASGVIGRNRVCPGGQALFYLLPAHETLPPWPATLDSTPSAPFLKIGATPKVRAARAAAWAIFLGEFVTAARTPAPVFPWLSPEAQSFSGGGSGRRQESAGANG